MEEPSNKATNAEKINIETIEATLRMHKYAYQRPIGHGGFATVHLVISERYQQEFVVKVTPLFRTDPNNGGMTERDQKEVSTLINLSHPNIISMFEYFSDDHYLYIILEYCRGGSLQDIIDSFGAIKPPLLYEYCYQILCALNHCHKNNVAHRDLKPANVLIDNYGRLKLADFGLSSKYEIGSLSVDFGGSKPYMPPEVLFREAFDPFNSDIWSLGVTFYQMAVGKLPWMMSQSQKEMELAISMGMISFNNTKTPIEFIPIIKSMMKIGVKRRPPVSWIMDQDIFKEILLNRQIEKQQMLMSKKTGSIGKSVSINSNLSMLSSLSNQKRLNSLSQMQMMFRENMNMNPNNMALNEAIDNDIKQSNINGINAAPPLASMTNDNLCMKNAGGMNFIPLNNNKNQIPIAKSVLSFHKRPGPLIQQQTSKRMLPTFA